MLDVFAILYLAVALGILSMGWNRALADNERYRSDETMTFLVTVILAAFWPAFAVALAIRRTQDYWALHGPFSHVSIHQR